jgi:membrane protein YdbS with pleckstrin-like domain
MMNKYLPAILSALVVILLAAAYAVFWFLVIDDAEIENVLRIVIAVVSLFVVVGVGWALISRIRELRGGQEDDLGKY